MRGDINFSSGIWTRTNSAQDKASMSDNETSFREIITARRFNSVHNAATRTRSSNFQEAGPMNDDSIIGDTTVIDLTDGVDLRAKKIDMSFNLIDATSLLFSMTSFFLDQVTDIVVACFHYLNNDYWYCALTLTFIIIPNLITSFISMRWYILDSRLEGSEPVSKTKWTLRFIGHMLLVGPILRHYESLQYGISYRESSDPEEKKRVYMKMIYEDADATMLRLFESFMESSPQLMLQMYIIAKNYPFDDYEYWTIIVQIMSISSSLISISWSLVSYSKCLRISLPNKMPMTYWSMGIMFSWEFFSMTARMIALALFTSIFVHAVGFVCLLHWACMTLWIITMKTSFCDTKCEELAFNVVLGFIFIFCYFNPVDNATRYRYLMFYTFMLCENTILMFTWAGQARYDPWLTNLIIKTHYSCFFLGITLMLIYYRWFHPTGGIRLSKGKCLNNPQTSNEFTNH